MIRQCRSAQTARYLPSLSSAVAYFAPLACYRRVARYVELQEPDLLAPFAFSCIYLSMLSSVMITALHALYRVGHLPGTHISWPVAETDVTPQLDSVSACPPLPPLSTIRTSTDQPPVSK